MIKDEEKNAADLHWLAFLLTGQRDISIQIAVDAVASEDDALPAFPAWLHAWSRRIVVAQALAAVRAELAESAARTESAKPDRTAVAPRDWSLSPDTSKSRLEQALLGIDIFPRAALILSIFEGVQIADAAILLDAGAALVRKAQSIGLRELVRNLAPGNETSASGYPPDLRLALAAL